ncbi:MAG TPA: hypothetical protein VLI93_17945 [Acetobacteraceae bacterium]|nr:hypothetical protein [Acetobacteraceae bacterium]
MLLGLTPAAWVIIMVAVATYCALASSYYLARPGLRTAPLQAALLQLQGATTNDPQIRAMRDRAIVDLEQRLRAGVRQDDRSNWTGRFLLVLSVVIFSAAVVLQLVTDPAFRGL